MDAGEKLVPMFDLARVERIVQDAPDRGGGEEPWTSGSQTSCLFSQQD